ncbi:hypothetical protein [Fimbriiglobus ruber]|uniref:Transmembrane protein n=1 Tax=Fimbriiglobus ruber TaxID=1908690 RepID=A0A225D4B3_9BACT|nr:hypothetical protein [Fimbriiglobus ruber]OWK35783.1 hypothetical protein FRUB_08346 [Fimbriiglobus ruber]
MSLDYPYYEELCRRKHRAAWWWRIGDTLYYLGLLPAMFAIPGAGFAFVAGLSGFGWHWLLLSAIAFGGGAVVFVVGSSLKGHAYRLAERDGILSSEVYARGAGDGGTEVK